MLTDIRKSVSFYEDADFEEAMDSKFIFISRNADGSEAE
jgi:hypothetical protein